ncbi:MAG: sortase [Chloroflexota bacterium]
MDIHQRFLRSPHPRKLAAILMLLVIATTLPGAAGSRALAAPAEETPAQQNLPAPLLVPNQIDPPTVTLAVVPAQVLIGSNVNFGVTFDNNDPENEVGYGPFIDVVIPVTGADGAGAALDDGLGTTTISASYLGSPIPAQDFFSVAFNASAIATHPFAVDASGANLTISCASLPVPCRAGDRLVVVRLPFGSFAPDQPPATVSFTVNMSNLADLGTDLTIQARGGYQYGFTPLDDWCCGDSADMNLSNFTSGAVTPTLLTLSKSYTGPADTSAETATGPNYPRQYTVSVNIAPGQETRIANLTITDELADNQQYVPTATGSPAGYTLDDQPVAGAAQNPPDNDLVVRWASLLAGTSSAATTFSFFIPRDQANPPGGRVIDAATGTAVTSCNQASASATWTPIDTRDAPQAITIAPSGCEHTLTDRSIAIQKGVAIDTDAGIAGYSPGDVLEYTLTFQVSDYFAFDQVVVTDIISDGQRFDPSFTPTIEVTGNGFPMSSAGFNGANFTVDVSNIDLTDGPPGVENPATNGTTILTLRVSDEVALHATSLPAGDARTQALLGRLIGGCVPLTGSPSPDCGVYDDDETTITIVFRTFIDDDFSDDYPSGDWSVDQGDILRDNASVTGRLLDTNTFAPGPNVSDDAAVTLTIGTGTLTKSIYAVNGSTSFSSPVEVKPGDTVTYRITYVMPTSNEENLEFTDYLPLPVFFVGDPDANDYNTIAPPGAHNDGPAWVFNAVGQNGQPSVTPAAGRANFGQSDTFYTYTTGSIPGGLVPAITPNATNNRLTFTYGDFDDPANLSRTVDILFTVTVAAEPFADRMYLTNQAHAFEGSTNGGIVQADAIVQIILTEPIVRSTKGVVWTSNPGNVFTPVNPGPAGVTFLAPGSAPRWTGTITDSGPVPNSDVRGVDAGDIVTFAITLVNSGTSLKGAFDIQIEDILRSQYQIPGGVLTLQVYYGDGTGPIAFTGLAIPADCTGSWPGNPCGPDDVAGNADDLFGAGIELIDPPGVGVCQAHNPLNTNDVIVITYDLQIRTGVAPGDIINTSTLVRYAGEEGGPNHVPTPSPYTETATVTVSGPPDKYIVATSESHTSEAGTGTTTDPRLVAVGEIIRYRLVVRIPESTSVNYQVVDALPDGLLFLPGGPVTYVFISDGGIASTAIGDVPAVTGCPELSGIVPNATVPPATDLCPLDGRNVGSSNVTSWLPGPEPDTYNSGSDIYFKLGNLVNSDLDDDAEYVVIEFNALVHNQTTHQNNAGSNRDNIVRVFAGSPLLQVGVDSALLRARVVEPVLTLNKTHSAIAATVDAGDTVTYTITIANPAGSNRSTAFDVDFTDTLPVAFLTLLDTSIPANFSITLSGGATGATNLSAGNTVQVTIAEMPVGGQAVITYKATVTDAVTPSQAVDNTGEVTWTSLPGPGGTTGNPTGSDTPGTPGTGTGERDGSGGIPIVQPNDHILQSVVPLDIHDPFFSKSIEVSNAPHTSDPSLAIGEVVTFGLYVTLPEGTTPALSVEDDLPFGLSYVPGSYQVVTQTSPPAACGSLAADFNGTLPLPPTLTITPPSGGSGANVTFAFGAIDVTSDNVTTNNSFLICFDAVLLNEAGNQASPPPLTNAATMTVGTEPYPDSKDITIVEPVLQINKSVDIPAPVPGNTITFTLIVDHTGASNATAFDVVVIDNLPAGLDLTSVTITASPGLVGVVDASDLAADRVEVTVDTFPFSALPPVETLTIQYTADVTTGFGTVLNNVGVVTWTSLPGAPAEERTGADGVGGALDDYAAQSSQVVNTHRELTKSLVADSFPAPVTTNPEVTIGEILTYELVLTVPPNENDLYTIIDTLNPGLAFVDCEDIIAGADLASSTITLNAPGNCIHGVTPGVNNPVITNSGQIITFDFGTLTNADATNPQDITIRYRVVVLDIAANVRNITLNNSAVVTWSLDSLTRQATPLTILEPDLDLEKTVNLPVALPGTVLTFSIRVFQTGLSQIDAFDVVVNDIVPEDLNYIPGSLSFVAGSGVTPDVIDDTGIDPVTGSPALRVVWDILPLGQESTVQFRASLGAIGPGESVVNTANVEWTSLPGDVPALPATYLSFYNQPDSHERRYDPLNPADVYFVEASATVRAPLLPETGFAPGRVTPLPEQPLDRQYRAPSGLRLEIPRLNMSLPIIGIPLTTAGWDLTWLWNQAGYLERTAYPGRPGNTGITAHVYLPTGEPGPFLNLSTLRWGDQIILYANSQRYIYEVRTNRRILPNDPSALRHEEFSWLSLITCQGYSEVQDDYTYRIVVRAVLIRVEADTGAAP